MKLTVRFGDEERCILEVLKTGVGSPTIHRTVVVKLTREQAALLKRRELGRRDGRIDLESREVIALED